MTTDPTDESLWRPLRDLLDLMDDDIARLYAERGVAGVRPRFSMALIRLHHLGPMTIRQLAAQVEVTHSAMSQTVTAMRQEGLVDTAPGRDARTRTVALTDEGRRLRDAIEQQTDAALAPVVDAIGPDLPELIRQLDEWSGRIVAGGGAPPDVYKRVSG